MGDVVCLLCFCFYKQVVPTTVGRSLLLVGQQTVPSAIDAASAWCACVINTCSTRSIATPPFQHPREVVYISMSQIAAIMLAPAFPGVLAPLRFNPVRFEEFAGFASTLCGTWVGAALLLGAYNRESTSGAGFAEHFANASMVVWIATDGSHGIPCKVLACPVTGVALHTADIQTAAWKAFTTWGCAMPIAAAQLVLVTAAEDGALVSDFGFASKLPLAASGTIAVLAPAL